MNEQTMQGAEHDVTKGPYEEKQIQCTKSFNGKWKFSLEYFRIILAKLTDIPQRNYFMPFSL